MNDVLNLNLFKAQIHTQITECKEDLFNNLNYTHSQQDSQFF